jgi:hypothetical protein
LVGWRATAIAHLNGTEERKHYADHHKDHANEQELLLSLARAAFEFESIDFRAELVDALLIIFH